MRLEKYLTTLDGDRSQGMDVFFDELQRSFNLLGEHHQYLFLDIALYAPGENGLLRQRHLGTSRATLNEIVSVDVSVNNFSKSVLYSVVHSVRE